LARSKKTIVIPLPKVKERGVMPKPTRLIQDPKKASSKGACRKKVALEEEPEEK
jgi:hypothetical protein